MTKRNRTKSGHTRLSPQALQIKPRPDFLLDYQNCSNDELRSFVIARGGELEAVEPDSNIKLTKQAAKKQLRIQLIQKLAQMDEDATFPFLDLLPELRNMIYVELLSGNSRVNRPAYPNILRASRQVHNEAAGILLAESDAYLGAIFEANDDSSANTIRAYAQFDCCLDFHVDKGVIVDLDRQSLPMLSKIQNLHIDLLVISDGIVIGDWFEVSFAFHLLAQTFSSVVKLSIDVEENLDDRLGPQGKRDQMASVFSSLAQLSDKVTVDIRGLDEATYDAVWKRINSS